MKKKMRFKLDFRQVLILLLSVITSRFTLAGVHPLVPALFMIAFVSGVNRSLLFLCTMGGLIVLAPVTVLIKYGMVILLSALAVILTEWNFQGCSIRAAAAICGGITTGVTLFFQFLRMPDTAAVWIGILEGIFLYGCIYLGSRLLGIFMEWELPLSTHPSVFVRSGQKLNEYAESFGQLSQTFQKMNRYKEDFSAEELSRMQNEVTGRVCVSCGQSAVCWKPDTPMYQILYRFLQAIKCGDSVEESSRELQSYCPYSDTVVEQAMLVFEKARLNMAWYNRLQENRDVIAQQLDAMAYIMADCAKEELDVTAQEGKLRATLQFAWKELGVVTEELRILRRSNEKLEICFCGHAKGKKCISVREMVKIINNVTGMIFLLMRDGKMLLGEESEVLIFQEASRLTAHYGVARAVREDETVCGDSFSFQLLDNGVCVMSLSDGMGSGAGACKESEMVIDLIEKFMEAGFHPRTALRMMNSAMVTHAEYNLFSTVDLMYLNLDSGKADFYKIGAAATFVRHKDQVACMELPGMPVGAFADQPVDSVNTQIDAGDFVVMMTDGVLDYLPVGDPKAVMQEILRNIEAKNPEQFSRQVLEQVLRLTGGHVRDDMTILVAGIWDR